MKGDGSETLYSSSPNDSDLENGERREEGECVRQKQDEGRRKVNG